MNGAAIISNPPVNKRLFEVQSEVPYDFIRKRLSVQQEHQ